MLSSLRRRIVRHIPLSPGHEYTDSGLDCADTMIIRTKTRQELLYTRSQIAITAKAYGLEAIDMVCATSAMVALIQLD